MIKFILISYTPSFRASWWGEHDPENSEESSFRVDEAESQDEMIDIVARRMSEDESTESVRFTMYASGKRGGLVEVDSWTRGDWRGHIMRRAAEQAGLDYQDWRVISRHEPD